MAPEEAPLMVNTTEGSMKTRRARKWVRCGGQHRYIQEEWLRGDGGQWRSVGRVKKDKFIREAPIRLTKRHEAQRPGVA